MFDVLKTLSALVKPKSTVSILQKAPPVPVAKRPEKIVPNKAKKTGEVIPSIDMEAERKLAQAQSREIIIEAKDEALRIRREAEAEVRRLEENVRSREVAADRKDASLESREKRVLESEEEILKKREEIDRLHRETIEKLENVARLTREEAKRSRKSGS